MMFHLQHRDPFHRYQVWETRFDQLPCGLIAGAFECEVEDAGPGFTIYVLDRARTTIVHRFVHPMPLNELLDLAEEAVTYVLCNRVQS